MNCIDWFEAFAFCAWDGGRLSTEAEWNYAAAAGSQQRVFPWSNPPASTTIDDTYSASLFGPAVLPVGSTSPKGDGLWTQADLGGGVLEWNLDWFNIPYRLTTCNDCADLVSDTFAGYGRVIRGGPLNERMPRTPALATNQTPTTSTAVLGARCARTPWSVIA